jgi:two-component system, sensor histidine kinase and response regulator
MKTVLYVDDEKNNLDAFKAAFRRDFEVHLASSAEEARKILMHHEIAVLVTDQRMPSETGTQLLRKAVATYPDQIRILVTAYSDTEAIVSAVNEGFIFKYHKKPWDEAELRRSLTEACEKYNRIKELTEKERRYKKLIDEINETILKKE